MDAGPDPGTLAQDLFYAGLRALRTAVALDLCAYLHVSEGQGPQLFLGTPDLGSIKPNDAFRLFTALRDALQSEVGEGEELHLGGYAAIALFTAGPQSRGLHVLGRRDAAPAGEERATLLDLGRTFAALGHDLEALAPPAPPVAPRPATPARVAVEMADASARAEVSIAVGDELRGGTAEAPSAPRAVALAVLDALDASLKLVEVAEDQVGGERVILVLVADELELLGLGSALVDERSDVLRSAAVATIQASSHARGTRA